MESSSSSSARAHSGLQQRRTVGRVGSPDGLIGSHGSGRRLARFDLLPKVAHDIEVRTSSGGAVWLLTAVAVIVMVLVQLVGEALSRDFSEKIEVDTTLREQLRINVNVTFHALACSQVEFIAMDATGEHHLDVEASVKKHVVERGVRRKPDSECGDCFGAGDLGRCCNSCAELVEAYIEKNWDVYNIMAKAPQCEQERKDGVDPTKLLEGQHAPEHGCNVEGIFEVNKVAGNFHVALGHGKSVNGRLLHQFSPAQLPFFNTSHTIHKLWFGASRLPQGAVDPLAGKVQIVDPHMAQTAAFQYFIEVVPMLYNGDRYFQYTASEQLTLIGDSEEKIAERIKQEAELRREIEEEEQRRAKAEAEGHGSDEPITISEKRRLARAGLGSALASQGTTISQLPGVFFVYDISPFAIVRKDRVLTVTQVLVDLLAIVGGTLAFSKFLDGSLAKVLCKRV